MPNFKVLNPDNPEEIDLIQDIPVVDEETGSDQIDEEGNVIVKRYITRSVNKAGITAIKAALPQIKENIKNLQELHEYSHSLNATQQKQIDDNASDISTLLSDVSALELSIVELENKIKGIQGIDIDDLKEYVETQIPLIKSSYLPLTGGTITGNLKVTEGTVIGNLTGTSDKAVSDKNGKKLTDYVTDILGANAQLTITKGDGTNQLISINNVLAATKATQDNAGQQIDATYIKGLAANNATLTYTKGNNTTGNITINNVANATTATTATKLATARNIAIGQDMTGSANFDGSGNITINVARRMCYVGQSTSTTTNPYYKFASINSGDLILTDFHITFKVSQGFNDNSTAVGILTAHARTNSSGQWERGELVWEYVANGLDPAKFILVHNTSTNPTIVELWAKCDTAYTHYFFEVISEHARKERGNTLWTLYTLSSAGSQSAVTSGYTQITSTVNVLRNSILGSSASCTGNAATATLATKATSDANGANIASTYTKLATAQTISAQHNFSTGVKISGYLVTIG